MTFMKKMVWIGLCVAALTLPIGGCSGGGKDTVKAELYTCAMHPQIIRDKPGNCPICGMALVKKENARRELDSVNLDGLLEPANRYVLSQVPVTAVRKGTQDMTLNVLGRVDYDTRREHVIAARFSGRIERLYVRYRFQHIHAGDRIMDIYSPDLVTAQENLLFVLKNDASNAALMAAAKERLLLLGMERKELDEVIRSGKPMYAVPVYSPYMGHIHAAGEMGPGAAGSADGQVGSGSLAGMGTASGMTEELPVKEGMYVERGQAVFKLYNTDRSWVLLDLYPDQESLVKLGTAVEVTAETAPGKLIRGKVDFLEPVFRTSSKTVTARIYFDNSALDIPIGSQVKGVIQLVDTGHKWLPATAVLSLGLRKVVLMKEGGGFRVKVVETGASANGKVQVLKGLRPEDSVAVNAQYLMDSESFIKSNEER